MKNSKFLKRFLAFVLSAAMVLTYMPTSMIAFAEDEAAEAASSEPKAAVAEEVKSEPAPAPKVEEPAPAPAAEEPAAAPAAEESTPAASEEATASEETSDAAEETAPAETAEAVTEEQAVDPEEKEEEPEYPADTFKGSAGGVSVVIDAPEGALPKGTKLDVTAVAASDVQAAVEGAIGGEAGTIKAVDITFVYEGKKIEPKKSVTVHLNASGIDSKADKKVVHIADSGAAEVVTDNVTSGGAASFSAKEFSIYLVVGEDQTTPDENAVATYEFYADDELVQTQYIKTGDKIADPGNLAVGADEANTVFKGWFIGNDPVDFDTPQNVDRTKTVRVDAKIEHTYYVTFWGEKDSDGNRGIVAVKSVTVEGTESGTVDISDVTVTPKSDTSAFKGWSESATGTETISGNTVSVSDRMDLYAVVVNAHWIHFYENVGEDSDSDATYTGPVFVAETDVRSSKKPADPTRKGYTFGGWYEDEACNKAFDWTATGLDEDTDLYAKWVPGKADLKVIVWKQKVTDDKDAADTAKTYDFEMSAEWEGTTGETVDLNNFSMYKDLEYTGFHFSRMVASPEKVKADGTTVVNVYYDRNRLTIKFVDGSELVYEEATDNERPQYGLIDGEYVQLDRHGRNGNYTWTYDKATEYSGTTYRAAGYWDDDETQYGFVNGEMVELTWVSAWEWGGGHWEANGERYNGDRYVSPAYGYSGYGVIDGEVTGISNQDGKWVSVEEVPYTGTRYKAKTQPKTEEYTGLYGSTLESNGYTWPDNRDWYQNPNRGGTRLTFLDAFKFEGLSGTSEENTVLTQYGADPAGDGNIRFYKQNIDETYPGTATNTVKTSGGTFTITEKYEGFKAVEYRNGNGNWHKGGAGTSGISTDNLQIRFERQKYSLTFMSEGDVFKTVGNIPYEDVLSSYKTTDEPTKAHYDFVGWFEDPAGQTEFDWSSKMPAANKVVYAKFVPKQYHVSLDADGGKFINAQVGEFNVPLDTILDKTSLMTNVEKEKHELIGWFDKATGEAYGYGKIEEDVNLIAKWRYPGQVQIVYDATPHGSGAPEDNYKYATDSSVVLGAPPTTVDKGWAFVAWEVAGKKYYSNNTFDITEDIIENYDETTKTGTVTVKAIYADLSSGSLAKTSIKYNANGGTGADVVDDKDGELLVNEKRTAKTVEECGFTRDGYKFVEWNTDPEGKGLSVKAGKEIAADLFDRTKNTKANTLYAQWVKVYTVTFDPDGGAPDSDDQTVESGEKATEPTDPTKDNNTFLGWFEVIDGEMADTAFDFNTAITKDTDLKAKWEPTTVTVTFDANGHGTAPDAQTIDKGATATKPADLSEAGFEFGGWFTEAACTNEFDFATPVNEDKTLYAKWTPIKYTVTFESAQSAADKHGRLKDPEGAMTDGYTKGNIGYGEATPAVTAVPNAGYEFAGWIKESTGATVQNPDATVTRDETYTATWTPKTDTGYTVNWYYQTPGSEDYVLKKTETRTGTTGAEVQLTDADQTPEAQHTSGYTYDVNISKTSTKTTIAGDGSSEMHVYFWPVYNIVFEAGDHGKLTDAGGAETDKLGPHPQHYGDLTWAASGWEKNPDEGYEFEKWDPVLADKVTGHATYVAQWKAKDVGYKVEFYYQADGEYPETATSSEDRTGKTDASVEVTADDKKPTKDGYVLDESKSDAWTGKVKADGSLVLKVYFKQQFTVTFDANGHGTAPDAQTVDAGKTANKPTDPSESGFVFGGWFTDAECTTEYDFSTPVNEDMTLYAKWTEAGTATITYDLNGGTYNGSTANIEENYKIGEVISIHAAPDREGYVFSYWQGSAYQPGDSYTVEGDHTFTAVWVAIEETDDDSDKSDKTDKSKGVKTGDEADLAGWLMLMLIAGAGTGYIALGRKREED